MKTLSARLVVSALLSVAAVVTLAPPSQAMSICCSGSHVRWAGHHDPADARLAITTQDGKVTLLLTDHDVAMQLSDRMLHRIRRQLRRQEEDADDNVIGMAIASAVIGTVDGLIDNSFECRLHDVRDATYESGRLILIGRNGRPVFQDADLCDTDVLSSFSESDAKNFVSEFRKIKSGS